MSRARSLASVAQYTPVNKAGDTMTGNFGVGSTPAAIAGKAVQLGSASSVSQLDVNGDAYFCNNAYYDGSNWRANEAGAGGLLTIGEGGLAFHNAPSVAAGAIQTLTERIRVDAVTNNLFLTGLQGVKFQSTQSPSTDPNTLDDYEEGTWTPVLFGTTTAGTFTPGAASGGAYIKIGKLVWISANVNGAISGAVGDAQVSGLPFTRGSGAGINNAAYSGLSVPYWAGIAQDISGALIDPASRLYFHVHADNTSSGAAIGILNGTHNIHIAGCYLTNA